MRNWLIAAVAGLGIATPALACSPVPGYQVPTNLELAIAGETIVIAEVYGRRAGGDKWSGTVLARPIVTLKGGPAPATIELQGAWLSRRRMRATSSDQRELRAPNPDAMIGGCVRYVFSKGMKLVLFLHRDTDGKLVPYRSPFSRDAEDVVGRDALWVKAVREYAAISLIPEARRQDAMRARITELTAAGDAASLAVAQDLRVELDGKRRPPFD